MTPDGQRAIVEPCRYLKTRTCFLAHLNHLVHDEPAFFDTLHGVSKISDPSVFQASSTLVSPNRPGSILNGSTASIIAILGALGMALMLRTFYRQQSQGKIGASISLSKAYWLGLVIYCWYILGTIFLFLEPKLAFHTTFLLTSLSVWLRAPIELVMRFHHKSWLPKYGIAHNWATLVVPLLGAALHLRNDSIPGALDLMCLLIWTMSASMELYYSVALSKIVGDQNMGARATCFTNAEGEAFVRINRVAARNNVLLTLGTVVVVYLMATH